MLAAVAYRAADGSFLPAEPFEIKRPDEEHGNPVLDTFARWAAERYRREREECVSQDDSVIWTHKDRA